MAGAWKQPDVCGKLWADITAGVICTKWVVVVTDNLQRSREGLSMEGLLYFLDKCKLVLGL